MQKYSLFVSMKEILWTTIEVLVQPFGNSEQSPPLTTAKIFTGIQMSNKLTYLNNFLRIFLRDYTTYYNMM